MSGGYRQLNSGGSQPDYSALKTQYFHSTRKVFYPIRPIFSFFFGGTGVVLSAFGFIPSWLAISVFIPAVVDDVVLFPIFRMMNMWRNIKANKKIGKSRFNITLTLLGYLAGALLGGLLLPQLAAALTATAAVVSAIEASITVYLAACVVGVLLAKIFNYPTMLGALLGAMVAPFLPLPFMVPAAVDLAVGCTLLGGFVSTLLAKQLARAYYKLRYGHSNADGYDFLVGRDPKTEEADLRQAAVFSVKPGAVKAFRAELMKILKMIRKKSGFGAEIIGLRQQKSAAFKDMLYLLMNAKTDDEANRLRELVSEVPLGDCWADSSALSHAPEESVVNEHGRVACLHTGEANFEYRHAWFKGGAIGGFLLFGEKGAKAERARFKENAIPFATESEGGGPSFNSEGYRVE